MPELQDKATLDRPVATTTEMPASSRRLRAPRGRWRRLLRVGVWLPPLIAFAIAAGLWQWYAHGHPYTIPTIGHIWTSLHENSAMYWANFKTTFQEVAIGATGGIVLAFLLAVLMAELPIFERALMPLMVTLMVTPIVAIAPALVIAFGFGQMPKYVLTGLIVFFPMLINSLAGLRDVDPGTLDVFRTLHATRWETFRYLRFPGSMPFVFAGLRISLPLAVVGATVAEFAAAGATTGLGGLITVASSQANLPVIWASIFLLCLMGLALVGVLAIVRNRVLWWDNEASLRNDRGGRAAAAES